MLAVLLSTFKRLEVFVCKSASSGSSSESNKDEKLIN
jgi:hypothetical protein